MKVSIITVVYNNERTIADAIESVFSQTYKDIEYIVIDGCSIDNTLNVLDKYKEGFAFYQSEKDDGIYDAMNKGIRAATGEVVGFLNSDDLYANSSILELVMTQFLHNPALDIVYGDLDYVQSHSVEKVVRVWKSRPYHSNFFDFGDVPPHPTLFLKRTVYERVGLFNTSFTLSADYELMLRIFKKNEFQIKYLNVTMVKMRLGGATNRNVRNVLIQNREILRAWKSNGLSIHFFFFPLKFLKRLLQFF